MAIDPLREQVISLREATALFPRNRRGRKRHVSAIYRYILRGLRGIRLESIQCAGQRATSREAVARFFARLTELSNDAKEPIADCSAGDERRDADVERELDGAGL